MKKYQHIITRRTFLERAVLGGTAVSLGWPMKRSWAVPPSAAGRLRLLYYTDIHARVEWDTPVGMMRAVEAMNRHDVDLVLAGGDLITDGFQSSAETVDPRWDVYMEMHRAIEGEIHPMIGNHDLVAAIPEDGTEPSENPRAIFLDKMGIERTYRSFDAAGYHVIILDSIFVTSGELKYNGRISEAQLEWLKGDLAALRPGTPIVLLSHIPLVTAFYQAVLGAGEPAPHNRVVVNNIEVLDLFRGHNLILVLQGHLHVNEMLKWRGTTFITGGAVCGKWWRGDWKGTGEGFGLLTLDRDHVDWEYVEYAWEARRP